MPPNQKHTQAFTYEPPRIAQECITSEARGRQSKKAGSSGPLYVLPFLSTSHVAALLGGGEISGGESD